MKLKLLLELDDDVFMTRTIDLPFAPWVGLDLEFVSDSAVTCCDECRITTLSWNVVDNQFEAYCDFIVSPDSRSFTIERMLENGWKHNK